MANNTNSNVNIDYSGLLLKPEIAEKLFDHMSDTVFFIKDLEGRYKFVNQTLVERCGKKNKHEILGKTSDQVIGEELGKRYVQQDFQVIKSQCPLIQYLELHNFQYQELGWCMTTKLPLINDQGECIGLIGVSHDLKWPDINAAKFEKLQPVLEYVENNLEDCLSISEMAEKSQMSHFQLDRRMKILFGLSTGKWLTKTRISKASKLLLQSDETILDIAFSVGYSDQSAFTKQFKKITGQSPLKFKRINKTK
jgi:AraC-like DNA-binding protein